MELVYISAGKLVLIKVIGMLLIIDGSLSVLLVNDNRWLWQLGRGVRIFCGLVLLIIA